MNALVVGDALHQVARKFGVEKADGQFGQFDQKVRNQADVHAGANMQQNPASEELHAHVGRKQHQLRQDDEGDKAGLYLVDPDINQCLDEEGENELQENA